MSPKSSDKCRYEKRGCIHRGQGHVKTEAVIGVLCPEPEDGQPPPKAGRESLIFPQTPDARRRLDSGENSFL